jgi:hypothetical protein
LSFERALRGRHHRLLSHTVQSPVVAAWLVTIAANSSPGAYTVERVAGGLNQPMYVMQAPGDNTSLYIVERADPGDQLGRIRKYNLQTQALTTFLDVSGSIISDGGLLSATFHPEFQSNGLFYVVSNNNRINALDEYKVMGDTPQLQRRLLQYPNLDNVFHTMNQAFFRPNGNHSELFVTTGDGGTQADDRDFNRALIESPTSPYGKLLKIDLTQPFTTPASTPGPGTGVSVAALGIRNPYRGSFDRQTGDFYFGDVGFNTAESVDFIPGGHFANPAAPALDFGWTDREGTVETVAQYAGGPGSPGDINPIFDYSHSGQPLTHPSVIIGQSVTGGYVYRGPVPEFQGRYFFADFVNGNVYSGSFDPSTSPATFNGTNLTNLQNHTADFEARIGGGANIQFLTSFGEDNSGNLYLVKFGNAFFPPLGQGEIFRITPIVSNTIVVEVNRDTGGITLANKSGAEITFSALTLTSAFGAIDAGALTPITGNYDEGGNGAIDPLDPWSITSPPGSSTQFSEASTGDPGAIAAGESIVFSPAGGWVRSPNEDLFASLLLGDGTVLSATVSYTGNSGSPFLRSDLNFNGAVDLADWSIFVASSYAALTGMNRAEAYAMGDLDADGDNDHADFLLFKRDYNAANGASAFESHVLRVPEPSALRLILGFAACLLAQGRSSCWKARAAFTIGGAIFQFQNQTRERWLTCVDRLIPRFARGVNK